MKPDFDFPRFPQTPYLKLVPSAPPGDAIATSLQYGVAKDQADSIVVEEKLDGANVRIRFDGENPPIVGNREHILKKGYLKDTPAKLQFRPLWGWIYDHKKQFQKLTVALGATPIVYGEWLYARHTIRYDRLPTLLIPFDLYLDGVFLDPLLTRGLLRGSGFEMPPHGDLQTTSFWGPEPKEGVVIKFGDGKKMTGRFKDVRADFVPRGDFNETPLERNGVAK